MERTIFRGANLLDGLSAARPDSTVVVNQGRIESVVQGEGPPPAPGDRVVDLGGRTLMPGMFGCHFHATYEGYTLDIFPIGIDKPPGYLTLRAANAVRSALYGGFTSIVGAGGGDDIDAQLKMAIEDGLIEGPRITCGSRDFTTRGGYVDLANWWWRIDNVGAGRPLSGADNFREAIREEIRRGAEVIKIYATGGHGDLETGVREFSRDELEAVVQAAHERGKLVRAHCAWKPAILECIEIGVDIIDHGDGIDEEVIRAMVDAGTVFVPSARYLDKLLSLEELRVPEAMPVIETAERELANLCRWVPEAQAAGVTIVLGDDYGVAFMSHGTYAEELEFYVKRMGIAPLDVIRWATINGARLVGAEEELGSVESGKLADLLVVDGDPSSDMAILQDPDRLLAIMKEGVFVKDQLPA